MSERGDAGFTLIELLVVIMILGILAATVVFAVGGLSDRGESAAEKADRTTLTHSEESYLAQNGASGRYGAESDLVPKYMASPSSLHDICMPPNRKAYEIINTGGSCPAGMSLAL